MYVNITGNANTEPITTMLEVLKGTSTFLTEPAPGIVYKNANIWVGTKSFATPRNIKGATIKFKVEKSWMANQYIKKEDIKMLRWEGKWSQLDTREIGEDERYSYFESDTISFSNFAITAYKSGGGPIASGALQSYASPEIQKEDVKTYVLPFGKTPEKAPPGTKGFELILTITAFSVVYMFWRRR